MTLSKPIKRLRIDDPDGFRLAAFDPADTGGLDKRDAQAMLADDVERLAELQQRLYADGRWAVLVVLQGMDAAGKDGVIEHVMTGLNPQGCNVHAFKAPTAEELAQDFLWRAAVRVPERRRIGIFNRSHYEETLVVRVHPELLERQKLTPRALTTRWTRRGPRPDKIVGKFCVERRVDSGRNAGQQKCMSIGGRIHDRLSGDITASARLNKNSLRKIRSGTGFTAFGSQGGGPPGCWHIRTALIGDG
jgi:hypothetical protein